MRRKWRENEEMERKWGNGKRLTLYISSFSLHFLPLSLFPTSKSVTFCCKMLNTALLSRMSQKPQLTRYEEIILGPTCCEEAPQVVPACLNDGKAFKKTKGEVGPICSKLNSHPVEFQWGSLDLIEKFRTTLNKTMATGYLRGACLDFVELRRDEDRKTTMKIKNEFLRQNVWKKSTTSY